MADNNVNIDELEKEIADLTKMENDIDEQIKENNKNIVSTCVELGKQFANYNK